MSRAPSIESIRRRIASLQAERDDLTSQTRSRAEIAAQLERQLATWSDAGRAHLSREFSRAAAGQPSDPLVLRTNPAGQFNFGPLLCTIMGPDAIRAALLASLEGIPEGVASADRLARIGGLSAQLDDLETQEEGLIVASCGAIERRVDARPEIILNC